MKVNAKPDAKVHPAQHLPKQTEARTIEPGSSYEATKRLIEWAEQIPDEVFANVPKDASKRYEEYLYGH
jgi:hypothetical protein